jgi:hypothetical protein
MALGVIMLVSDFNEIWPFDSCRDVCTYTHSVFKEAEWPERELVPLTESSIRLTNWSVGPSSCKFCAECNSFSAHSLNLQIPLSCVETV